LALLAPSLESLLATSRPVLVAFLAALLSVAALLLRLGGRLWRELARLSHHVYLILFLPISIEEAMQRRRETTAAVVAPTVAAAPNVLAVDFDKSRTAAKNSATADSSGDASA